MGTLISYLTFFCCILLYSCNTKKENVKVVEISLSEIKKDEAPPPPPPPPLLPTHKSNSKNSLDNQINLDVSYSAIACECAQWIETRFISIDTKSDSHFYLEPADSTLIDANSIWDGEHLPLRLTVTGNFYPKKGFPKNYKPAKGKPMPARVFRYTKLTLIKK